MNMATSMAPMEKDISRATRECWEAFHQSVNVLGQSPGHHQQCLDLKDEFEVFRAWARTSGARSEDHASLDYRLRGNLATRRLFITILEGLVLGLSRCAILLRPESPQIASSPASRGKTPTAEASPLSSDIESSSDESWHVPTIGDFLHDISNSVDNLVQISRAIKKSSTQSRSIRAEAYEEWEDAPAGKISKSKGFEDFVGVLLEYRYRGLHENVRNRLRIAISRCNRRIAYQRRYQSRIRYDITRDTPEAAHPSTAITAPAAAPSQLSASDSSNRTVPSHQADHLRVDAAAPSQRGTNVSASTLSPNFSPFDCDDKSSVSSGSAFSRLAANPNNELPPPPPLKGNERYFECPYCCIQLPRKRSKKRAWANHVISDLQPYVCVFDECSLSNQGFETEDDWVKHERWNHNVSWSCNGFSTHPPVTFRDRGEFKSHFKTLHPGIFSSPDIDKLVEVSATPSNELFDHCPFCDFTVLTEKGFGMQDTVIENEEDGHDIEVERETNQRRIKRHILDHLLALFQLALPPRSDIPDAASTGNTSKVDAETNRNPHDEDLDLIDAEYMDQEYVDLCYTGEESIPAASEDDAPFIQANEYTGHATNPLLRSFVGSAMMIEKSTKVSDIRSLVSTATGTMIDLIVMILDGLGRLAQLNDQQEILSSELRKLLDALRYYLVHFGDNPVGSFTAFFATAQVRESKSLFSLLHETLWAAAYKLDMVSSGEGVGRGYETEDLENTISVVQTCRRDIAMELTGENYVVESESDARRADISKKADLVELQAKIQLRAGMDFVHLNLTHLSRELIYRGDLFRKGRIQWVKTHVLLFDHYIVLAETLFMRDSTRESKDVKYDVSKLPIPMVLLVLESTNDDPIVDGIEPVATTTETPTKPTLLWPFRLKHLGRNQVYYTLGASTSQKRQDWCTKIIEAKQRHAVSLYKQKTEPFRLRVVNDRAFAFDGMPEAALTHNVMSGDDKSAIIQGTPLYRAIQEYEEQHKDSGPRLPIPVCRAAVNCATTFLDPYGGDSIVVVGTDYGVYISKYDTPKAWTRAITSNNITQIAVLEEFSLFLLLSDKSLIAYSLDTICFSKPSSNLSLRGPQRLSGARDVGFFATGRMKDRTLVFYQKREGLSSSFKVLEPLCWNSSTASGGIRSRLGVKKPNGAYFREYDEFHIPRETHAIHLFRASIALSTAKGIEVMTLDKKLPLSVPDLKPPEVKPIAERIRNLTPLGMFRLSDDEFLLMFNEVAVYVNKHGDVSRGVVMEFVGSATQACLVNGVYLVLIDANGGFVEVRNAMDGRLRQIVSGRNVRLLDDGANSTRGSIMIRMRHPNYKWSQIVLEMIVNGA